MLEGLSGFGENSPNNTIHQAQFLFELTVIECSGQTGKREILRFNEMRIFRRICWIKNILIASNQIRIFHAVCTLIKGRIICSCASIFRNGKTKLMNILQLFARGCVIVFNAQYLGQLRSARWLKKSQEILQV